VGTSFVSYTGAAGEAAATDPFFSSLLFLSHFNGVDGSTSAIDSSPSPKTITATGPIQLDSSQKKFGSAALYTAPFVDGQPSYFQFTNGSISWPFGDWTVEFWGFLTIPVVSGYFDICGRYETSTFRNLFRFVIERTGGAWKLVVYVQGGSGSGAAGDQYSVAPYAEVALNQWNHYALTRSGDTYRLFLNGVLLGSVTQFLRPPTSTGSVRFGIIPQGPDMTGTEVWIDDARISGVCRYTSNFAIPTQPFPDQ
jgi:hypothetical protein